MEFDQISKEHTRIAELSRRIGQILVERGDYEQAMHQFQLGLQYLEGIEHKEVARIYNEIGRVYWSQGKLKEAQEWTEKAFDLAERLLDPDELARLLYHAGIRYHRQGANRLAESHWLRSLEISEETGDLVMQARLYQNLGWQSETMGDYHKALARLNVIMRAMDTLLAFPGILLAMGIVAVLGPSSINAMIAVAVVSVPRFARVALERMLEQASQLGANAVINVRFTTSSISQGAAELFAYGTAVTVK